MMTNSLRRKSVIEGTIGTTPRGQQPATERRASTTAAKHNMKFLFPKSPQSTK